MWKKRAEDHFFEELCAAHYENVLRYLFRALGDEGMARDVTQEVFLTACAKEISLRLHPNPGGWLFQTAKNLAQKARREAFRRVKEEMFPEEEPVDEQSAVEQELDRQIDESQYVDLVLDRLSPEKRCLYSLYYVSGKPMGEIAAELGLEEPAVRMRFVRLRREIREIAAEVAEKNFGV